MAHDCLCVWVFTRLSQSFGCQQVQPESCPASAQCTNLLVMLRLPLVRPQALSRLSELCTAASAVRCAYKSSWSSIFSGDYRRASSLKVCHCEMQHLDLLRCTPLKFVACHVLAGDASVATSGRGWLSSARSIQQHLDVPIRCDSRLFTLCWTVCVHTACLGGRRCWCLAWRHARHRHARHQQRHEATSKQLRTITNQRSTTR